MSMSIWKTVLGNCSLQKIKVPKGAEFLCAREQFERVCVWYRCDPGAEQVECIVALVQTGDHAPADGKYLGTAMLAGGSFVLHVFLKVGWDAGETP